MREAEIVWEHVAAVAPDEQQSHFPEQRDELRPDDEPNVPAGHRIDTPDAAEKGVGARDIR